MTKKHEELAKICHHINETNMMFDNIKVNRRNGYYAVDRYDRGNERFQGFLFCGNWMETYHFLQGIMAAINWRMPF